MNGAVSRPAAQKERRGRALDRKRLVIGLIIPRDSNAILRRTSLTAIHRIPWPGSLPLQTRKVFRTDPSEHLRCTLTHFDHLHRIRISSAQFSESNAAGLIDDGACTLIPTQNKLLRSPTASSIAKHPRAELFSGRRNLTIASRCSHDFRTNKLHAVLYAEG
jgi:hypothetical protein